MKNVASRIYIDLLSLIIVTFFLTSPLLAKGAVKLEIVYPQNNSKISASSTFFVGNTTPGATLLINSQNVKVYPNGAFVQVVPLKSGENKISVISALSGAERRMEYILTTPEAEKIIPKSPMGIDTATIKPGENIVCKPGEQLNISFKGSTGNKAYFSIGSRRNNVPMEEVQPPNGVYKGTYTFDPNDDFKSEPLIVKMASELDTFELKAPSTISTITPGEPPIIAKVITDNAVVRDRIDGNRYTPLAMDTYLRLTGKRGSNFRYQAGGLTGWISEKDVFVLPSGSTPNEVYPFASMNYGTFTSQPDKVQLRIQLSGRVPVLIEQPTETDLSVKILGTKAKSSPIANSGTDGFLQLVKWSQGADNSVKIDIKTSEKHFWGYNYYYEGDSTLVIDMRKPPTINPNKPLKDITICIDPGHGGTEKGSVGPTGVPEKNVNLGIALALRDKLVAKGANVILTRADDRDTELYSRVDYAVNNGAVILVSLHNNALPDGKDPYKDHGSSTYFYHPQSMSLAKVLQEAMLEDIKFQDHGVYHESFVLTRPTQLLATLVEVGFMIHPDEYSLLIQPAFQTQAAASIARGLEYFLFTEAAEQLKKQPAVSDAAKTKDAKPDAASSTTVKDEKQNKNDATPH